MKMGHLAVAVVLAVSLLIAGRAAAERLSPQDYPSDMGNVQQGCSGVQKCLFYLNGAGNTTTAAIQGHLRTLTTNVGMGGGVVAHRPSGVIDIPGLGHWLYWSDSDISTAMEDVKVLSPQFGFDLITVSVSDARRAARQLLPHYQQQVGPWLEIEPLSPRNLQVLPVDPSKHFQVFVSYSADHPAAIDFLFQTGPSTYEGPSDRYSIILNEGSSQFTPSLHTETIREAMMAANAALVPYMSNDPIGMRYILLLQHAGQWVASPTSSGAPGVTSPPQGIGPGVPSGGGGVGIESFPDWLRLKKVP